MSAPFRLARRPGEGRLVLLGGASGHWATTEPVDRAAIAAITRDGPIAFLPTADVRDATYGASFLAQYNRLGAPQGYVVPIGDTKAANDAEHARLLSEASLIYIGGGDTRYLLDVITGTRALDGLRRAYAAGAVVVGASAGAIALSAWGVPLDPSVDMFEGWGWLPEAIVSPHHTPERAERLRKAVDLLPRCAGIGLPDDTALAFGPAGEPETWGAGAIDVIRAPNV